MSQTIEVSTREEQIREVLPIFEDRLAAGRRLKPVVFRLPSREQDNQSQRYFVEHRFHPESRPPWMFAMTGGFLLPFVTLFEDFSQLRVNFGIRHFLNRLFGYGGFEVFLASPAPGEAPLK